jgi:hypothetical protein
MKLVSFDIGLRNLAYCVMEGTNRSNLKIISWDLIDVMAESSGHDNPKCFKCKKPANWIKNEEIYACTLHRKKEGKPPTKTALTKKTVEELQLEGKPFGVEGTTKKVLVDGIYKHYASIVWTRCIKSTKQGSVVDLAPAIASSLEARLDIWKGSHLIACEQQPDKRMLCVQAMIQMWFIAKGYQCKGISAVHKLSNIITLNDHTKTYKGRKSTGIIHAAELVPTPEWKSYMMKHPKKDDLADCFLQGLWVVENRK